MKSPSRFPRLLPMLLVIALPTARAATVFTTDTLIGVNDMTYEGHDLVVSNAVLTVDGRHTFNSLRVSTGAMLTHSASSNGLLPRFAFVTNELHLLVDTNPVTLLQAAVIPDSIIVTDTNGLVAFTNEVDYVITNSGLLFTLRRTTNSFIPNGESVFVSYDYQASAGAGLNLAVTGNLEVEASASVDTDARGFGSAAGPGRGGRSGGSIPSGGGGGHGGYGGLSSSNAPSGVAHGSAFNPVSLGSGGGAGLGGNGGAGGGAIRLSVSGSCILNGTLTASGQNATNNRAGGGAGGSIWITAATITGSGALRANGGAGEPVHGGGGGGGRIALVATTNLFSGNLSAVGGTGWQRGGAGTLFVTSNSSLSKVTIDNGGFAGAMTPINFSINLPALEVRGRATAATTSSPLQMLGDLIVRSGSIITTLATDHANTLSLSVLGDAMIESGAVFQLGGMGFSPSTGNGAGAGGSVAGGGGGHGGYGGNGFSGTTAGLGGNSYGSIASPILSGSGGRTVGIYPGGTGGGAVRLSIAGKLQLDGEIVADGTDGSGTASGGASGGSVWLTLGGFSGNGLISANGGNGGIPSGGGGAGGRIAVTCNTSSFTGTMTAFGGAGAMAGGAGTIYTKLYFSAFADLRVDNGGLVGTNTPSNLGDFHNLIIGGGAIYRPTLSTLTLGSVTVGPNSTWLLGNGSVGANVTVRNDVIVAAEGVVSGDGLGYAPGQGPGAAITAAAGGGHGGFGGHGLGAGSGTPSPGGRVYDSTANPVLSGSGGGSTQQFGSAGGAAVRLTAGALVLDGRLSAKGNSNLINNGGGGAGGSVWLTLNHFSGSGSISADGGNGHLPNGGGGGGGRIAVYWNSNSFTGTYSAKGGLGFVAGGAGTIYLKANNSQLPSLILDNGGRMGTNTVLDVSPLQNLTLASGARVVPVGNFGSGSLSVSNLQMASGTTLYLTNNIFTLGTANIAAGAAILADGVSTLETGAGQTATLGSSGAGHAGYGGRGAGTASGGNVYEITGTVGPGSRGGGTGSTVGLGGGIVRLNVSGPLVVDGRISANGSGARTNGSGGGSGGNMFLTLSRLSGSGIISADGGSGHLPNGGGGGGGRISITCPSNLFSGTVSAKGGPGFAPGGAGLIHLREFSDALPIVIVDNGGVAGGDTLLAGLSSLLELNVRSGASVTSSFSSLTVSNLKIEANAALRVSSMQLTVGSAYIAAGGALMANGASSGGLGAGRTYTIGSTGGGHGGYGGRGRGGDLGGNAYDTTANPFQPGSTGGGNNLSDGRGGGSLRMTVSGPLMLDGRISANGSSVSSNNAGGGSGGTVALTLNQFSGSGLIAANGGSGHLPNGGGGGGGRIAVTWISNAFTGTYSAKGGTGFQAGGAGTIYLKPNLGQFQTPSLIVDNGGLIGTNTLFDLTTLSNLTITGGAVIQRSVSGTMDLTSLNIASNGVLRTLPNTLLDISGPTEIAADGSISMEGLGHAAGSPSGGGASAPSGSGGGGHAGFGGRGVTGLGGTVHGSFLLTRPSDRGGGGGGGQNPAGGVGAGGNGGGTIRITANGPFLLDGRISANGSSSVTNNGGGGAGGSVWLTLNELLGSGSITANGGNGHLPNGGGGGGGRIAVSYNYSGAGNNLTNGFLGTISARGGNGFMKGGAGTIHISTNNSNIAQVLVDNGGLRGTNTLVSGTGSFDLNVQGGAVAFGIGRPRDLFVRSNGWLSAFSDNEPFIVSILRDATFDAGGGIDLDGLGIWTLGSGSTFTTPRGGGSHGGYGGFSSLNSGNTYGSAISPDDGGSRGGNGSGSAGFGPNGGAGGGLAQMTVGGTLILNGKISANGRDGEVNSGGGSGGGLRLQAVTIAGNGRITAIGGNGNGTAGGGGGGRIAIYYTTNLFTGTISACGGSGGQAGGAGTIYLRDNLRSVSSLLLDNCGLAGANTPFSAFIGLATNLIVSGRAVAEAQGVIPVFSNLVVTSGGSVTSRRAETNLYLALLGDLTVTEGSGIVVDGNGFALTNGPGAGTSLSNQGAGGGYGGEGGSSASEATGGIAYGSPTRPTDRGSGGGGGSGSPASGSEGGGAIRLAVAGTIALDGVVTANGSAGVQDDSGGGSGGSIWITASKLTGHGVIEAMGGDGELYRGGGGGGGRIAVYSPMNTFTGLVSVAGGNGAMVGETGTIFTSGSLGGLEVISQTPIGVVSDVVREVLLTFDAPIDPLSVTPDDVVIHTPYGLLTTTNLSLSLPAPGTLRISFGAQSVSGDYRIEVGPGLTDLFAIPMSQVYTGDYHVSLPTISGTVTDTNGQPVAGVKLQAGGVFSSATTDTNGIYSLAVPVNWNGTVTPVLDEFAFVPGGRSYTNISDDVTNQYFQMVASLAPSLQVTGGGTNLLLTWNAYSGVAYQVFASTNLMDWVPFDSPIVGTNGLMQLVLPISDEPQKFFRLTAQN